METGTPEWGGEALTSRDPRFRDDPHPIYDRLRGAGVVHDPEYQRLLVTDHATARAVIRDRDLGVDARRASEGSYMRRVAGTGVLEGSGDNAYEPPLVLLDDPAHRRIRLLVSMAFTARSIEAETPRITRIADQLLDQIDGQDEVDLIETFAGPLPSQVIAELLGLADPGSGRLRRWSEDILWGYDPHRGPERQDRLRRAYSGLATLVRETVAERRRHPTDDLISAMVRARDDQDRLTELEIVSLCVQLMVAGNVTTSDLIGNSVYWLDRNRSQRERLAAHPELMPAAVEELLRYDCPITETARIAHSDTEVGGCPVAPGDTITVSLAAANHDPDRYPNPHQLDIERDTSAHLGFGSGPHVCLGAPLARLEVAIALGRLLERFPGHAVVAERARRRALPFFRGFEHLPVRLRA